MLPELSKTTVSLTVDLKLGYWHIVLSPEPNIFTTYATSYGRYRWINLFAFRSLCLIRDIPEAQALVNRSDFFCSPDDILVYGIGETDEETIANHDGSLQDLLQRS